LLVQASNGNTSIQLEGILWIKGSGKWLARANQEEILIPVGQRKQGRLWSKRGNCGTSGFKEPDAPFH
jgi:rhamnose utilization protein RhaD (predicted bifunctional aldolase and dehydrogenase)